MKKDFEKPELIIVLFTNDDIITSSGNDPAASPGNDTGFFDWLS